MNDVNSNSESRVVKLNFDETSPAVKNDSVVVGLQLKKLRKARDWSLSQLAAAADVSVGLLSQIERGRSIPSLRTLTKLRIALDVSLGTLVGQPEDAASSDSRFVKRREDRESLVIGDNRLVKEFLSPVKSDHLQVMMLDIPPGGGSGPQTYSYDAEKAGLVIQGNLKLQLGDDILSLREGDSFQFDSAIPHAFTNPGSIHSKIIWIICKVNSKTHI